MWPRAEKPNAPQTHSAEFEGIASPNGAGHNRISVEFLYDSTSRQTVMRMAHSQSRRAWVALVGSTVIAVVAIIGCGNETSTNVTQPDSQSEDVKESSQPEQPPASSKTAPSSASDSLVYEKGGKKWIGDVPLDVWYDDPLAVASTKGQIAEDDPGVEVSQVPEDAPKEPSEPMPMPESSDGIDWKRIIPAELLDAEVTTIRNRFTADLRTVGSYNSSYLSFPPHTVALAVLAHVARSHPGEIRWKENAHYVQHLAGEMLAQQPFRRGPASQRPLKEKFDYILDIFNGSVPATLEEPPEDQHISQVAKVRMIMKRLENASKKISIDGGTAEAMKSNAESLKQEAAVMGALTKVMLDGYIDYEDDELFEGYVNNLVETTVSMRENIENEQFEKFDLNVSKMNQSCQECHSTYR